MTRKEIQGNPKRTIPDGNTAHVFVFSTDSRVPLTEGLVGFIAALAWGDRYRRYIRLTMGAHECPLRVAGGK